MPSPALYLMNVETEVTEYLTHFTQTFCVVKTSDRHVLINFILYKVGWESAYGVQEWATHSGSFFVSLIYVCVDITDTSYP